MICGRKKTRACARECYLSFFIPNIFINTLLQKRELFITTIFIGVPPLFM